MSNEPNPSFPYRVVIEMGEDFALRLVREGYLVYVTDNVMIAAHA